MGSFIGQFIQLLRDADLFLSIPWVAKTAWTGDKFRPLRSDPGIPTTTRAAMAWLARAQDLSATTDGGVARHYSLLKGWGSSYPETTGYILPTVLDWAARTDDASFRDRGRRMYDWLTGIQFRDGGFQGGMVDQQPRVPVIFNTGQILLGLAAAVRSLGVDAEPMRRAAQWLVESQDPDGCWRKHPTPFAAPGEKAYETHVAWGLFEAERVAPGHGYGDAGLRQVRWALTCQRANGWFDKCCLSDPARPLTHTLGYVLRGVVEAYLLSNEAALMDAARRTADGLLSALRPDGAIAGRLDADWRPGVEWVCLTGVVQIAHSWLLLHTLTGDERYLRAGRAANRYVRRTVQLEGSPDVVGGVKGSHPIAGAYGRFEYLNWAAKFFIDANLLEQDILEGRLAWTPKLAAERTPAS